MAVKFFCDGCDNEIRHTRAKVTGYVQEQYEGCSAGEPIKLDYDMCDACCTRLKMAMKPKSWARAQKVGG